MRDFRDAKAMAQSLRKALAQSSLTVTHGQALELIAQTFGLENWNTLSAKIDDARAAEFRPGAAAPNGQKTLYCSFCAKSQHDVEVLIAGPNVFVCDGCVGLCDGIIFDNRLGKAVDAALESHPEADPGAKGAEILRGYGDEQLVTFRKSIVEWLDHIDWGLRHMTARLEGGEPPGPWKPDEWQQRRGYANDPMAGLPREEIQRRRAEAESRLPKVRERLQLIDQAIRERGLS
jgi:hypothetical protein